MSKQTFVIIGASLAGAKAAAELREQGFDGEVVLIGSERHLPYERPPLSKELLQNKSKPADAQVFEESFYGEHDITLLSATTATALDVGARTVSLDSGDTLSYDAVLLTTGSEPRALEVPGADLDNLFYLRTIDESEALAKRIGEGGRLVVVGGGWIGSEVAASARTLGAEVTIVDPAGLPNERIFGSEIGHFYADVHAQHGVTLNFGDGVAAIEGDGGRGQRRPHRGGQADRGRLRGHRRRRHAVGRAGPGGWHHRRQRDPRRRRAAQLRRRGVRRR